MIAATDHAADLMLAGIIRQLETTTENGDALLNLVRTDAADAASLASEGWYDADETREAVLQAATRTRPATAVHFKGIVAGAFAELCAPTRGAITVNDPADDFVVQARRKMATAQNGSRLSTLQALAIECWERNRCGEMSASDAGDLLHEIAEASGLTDELNPDDLQHVISEGLKGRAAIARKLEPTNLERHAREATAPAAASTERHLVIRRASDIRPEPISWFWRNRIARGKVTLIVGQPGLGKSQLTAALAASTTTGGKWPDEGTAPLGSVLVLSAEDDPADTQVPRLLAAGADCRRVHIISAVREKDAKGNQTFNLAADLHLLERELERLSDVSLITIDPLSSYLGKIDSHKNSEVRGVLEMVAEMAARHRVAVVGVTHFSKGEGSAINKVIGSIAFVAASRAAFMVAADPEDETRRLFVGMKSNLGRTANALAFRIAQIGVGETRDIPAPYIVWDSGHVSDTTADQILAASSSNGRDKTRPANADANDLLSSLLADGPRAVGEIQQEAVAAGLLKPSAPVGTDKAFRLARAVLGISREAGTVYREGGTGAAGQWFWRLGTARKLPRSEARAT